MAEPTEFEQKVFEIYEQLVYEEHDANKRPRCFEKDITREWVSGYQDGIGKALDLLGGLLGLGVKFEEDK